MSTPVKPAEKTPTAAEEAAGSGAGLGVSPARIYRIAPALTHLSDLLEWATEDLGEAEYCMRSGWEYRNDLESARKKLEEAAKTIENLLRKVGRGRRRKHLESALRFVREAARAADKALKGKADALGDALTFASAAWVDVQFALSRIRRGVEAPDGAEDLLVPDVPEREVPEVLLEREAELEAEYEW